jgi:hypothetical protein
LAVVFGADELDAAEGVGVALGDDLFSVGAAAGGTLSALVLEDFSPGELHSTVFGLETGAG